ncbi:heavy metal-binding domain-containing protein, partial [Candidatus Bathyarchaeota archaeon]|nr:heavy metal-binding domain-containing protein [Candidatus Bathyarchaeota archaeon]
MKSNVSSRGERVRAKAFDRLDDAKKIGPRGTHFHIFKQENPMWNLGRILSSVVMVVTIPTVPGYRVVRTVGPVYGMTIRSRGVGGRFVAGIQGMFGGEIT